MVISNMTVSLHLMPSFFVNEAKMKHNSILKFCAISITFVLSVFCADEVQCQNIYEVTVQKLNVRSEPTTASSVIGALNAHEQVSVYLVDNGWAKIDYKGSDGYVSIKYLKHKAEGVYADGAQSSGVYEVVAQKLNVRSRPTTESSVIGALNMQDQVDVDAIDNGWAKINYGIGVGYVSAKYLKFKAEKPEDFPAEQADSVHEDTLVVVNPIEEKHEEPINVQSHKNSSVGIDFVPSLYFGYANFAADGTSPRGRIGAGLDFTFQFVMHDKVLFLPKNYYMETSLGYAVKGSAAFPLHYIDLKLSPVGYWYDISDWTLFGKAGIYLGYTFSSVETNRHSFDTNMDVGILCGVGVEYQNIGLGFSYERSFTNAFNSRLKVNNQGFYLNLSYRLFNLK